MMRSPDTEHALVAVPTSGPAYSTYFKCLASGVVWLLAWYGWRTVVMMSDVHVPLVREHLGMLLLAGGAGCLLLLSWWHFLTSTTTVDVHGIRQTGIVNRSVEWEALRHARLIGLPFLERLFPPRLVLQTRQGHFVTFHGGTPALLEAFAHIAAAGHTGRTHHTGRATDAR
ncbi:hypothetical protein [Imbroritus primus]|uniref:hypothetical protein n=1 Tax=Imbroritus primus TaxID=3058603 RepID=UPI003D162221